MFMKIGFDPAMPSDGYKVARAYFGKLSKLGSLLSIGCGALFFVPLTQGMAFALASLLLATAVYLGREYRKYVDELLKQTPIPKLLMLFAPAWRYLAMTTLLLGAGVGLAEWQFFGQLKHLIIGAIASGGIVDVVKGLLTSR